MPLGEATEGYSLTARGPSHCDFACWLPQLVAAARVEDYNQYRSSLSRRKWIIADFWCGTSVLCCVLMAWVIAKCTLERNLSEMFKHFLAVTITMLIAIIVAIFIANIAVIFATKRAVNLPELSSRCQFTIRDG